MDTIQIKSKGDAHSFIMLVTRNQKHFMDNLPENFVMDLWDVYYKINCNIQNISSTETVLALLESCDDKQFEEIILKLNDNTVSCVIRQILNNLSKCILKFIILIKKTCR